MALQDILSWRAADITEIGLRAGGGLGRVKTDGVPNPARCFPPDRRQAPTAGLSAGHTGTATQQLQSTGTDQQYVDLALVCLQLY